MVIFLEGESISVCVALWLHVKDSSTASYTTVLENLSDEAIDKPYVTKFSTISLYLTKFYVT